MRRGRQGIFRVVRSSYEYKIHGSGIDSGRKKGKKPFYLHMQRYFFGVYVCMFMRCFPFCSPATSQYDLVLM